MKYKAIVIDDEKMARSLLKGMIDELDADIEVLDLCEDLPCGVKSIRKHKPDLVFLDIEMPGHSGLELLDFFDPAEITFGIIFTTAYNQYAVQAFKLSAIDYLLKPFSAAELDQSIQRFKRNNQDLKTYAILKENLLTNPISKIVVNTVNAIKFIELNSTVFLKADGAYTHLHLNDDSIITSSKSLKHFEDTLSDMGQFMRCHKSFIINLHYLTEYVKSEGGYLVMNGKNHVSLSAEKSDELMKRMKNIS